MILADKIIELRKKNGMTQDELAEKMEVSRQSVSKWEGAQSVPDLNRILKMSEIFGVSTDYLLKDDIEQPEFTDTDEKEIYPRLSLEKADEYIKAKKSAAVRKAAAVLLFIVSLVPFITMGAMGEDAKQWAGADDILAGIGMVIMLAIIAAGAVVMSKASGILKPFEYIENGDFSPEYGVEGMARDKKTAFAAEESKSTLKCVLCWIAGVALLVLLGVIFDGAGSLCESFGLSALIISGAVGTFSAVKADEISEGYDALLREGIFSPDPDNEKKDNNFSIMTVYWVIVAAVYFGFSFFTNNWGRSWVILLIGAILSVAVSEFAKLRGRRKNEK
ncbi:MAG: helix-turn-helix domain-containing protein [Ruminococcus sp.]|nr:helix-turn-helix domain-containing protein [Ruminococcus sp.]MBP3273085.1 helix-turn-helix domain-containing protein [Ruminococcus sp.]